MVEPGDSVPARRSTRPAIAASVLAMLELIGGIVALTRSGESGPQATRRVAAAGPTPNGSVLPSPAATDQGTPSGTSPSPSAITSAPAATPTRSSSHPTTARPPTFATTPTCQPKGDIQVTHVIGLDGNTTAHVDLDGPPSQRLCPGERVRVFWASYQTGTDGTSSLISSGEDWLDAAHTSVAIHISLISDQCRNPWFLAHGTDPIPQTLPAGARPTILSHPVMYNFPPATGCV
jgi:hypothetical protein